MDLKFMVLLALAVLMMGQSVVLTYYKKVQNLAGAVTHGLSELMVRPKITTLVLVASVQKEVLAQKDMQNLVPEVLLSRTEVTVVVLRPTEYLGIQTS
jgi:hypothetical protein